MLPQADTCFFNLILPNYTSKEALKERLLIAITFDCVGLNADDHIQLDPNAQNQHGGGGGGDSSIDQDDNIDF